MKTRPIRRAALIAVAVALAGCGGKEAESAPAKGLETVDVAPSLSVPTEGDIKAAPPKKGLVGILPNDFPRDLPIFLPASVIDFGKKDGRRFVLLQSQAGRAEVEAWLRGAAGQAGYRVEGQGGRLSLRKGERRYELSVTGQATSEFRYQY